MNVRIVPVEGVLVQDGIATRLRAFERQFSFGYLIGWGIRMFLFPVIPEVFLPEVTSPPNARTSIDITRINAFIVFLAHMLCVLGLGGEWFT